MSAYRELLPPNIPDRPRRRPHSVRSIRWIGHVAAIVPGVMLAGEVWAFTKIDAWALVLAASPVSISVFGGWFAGWVLAVSSHEDATREHCWIAIRPPPLVAIVLSFAISVGLLVVGIQGYYRLPYGDSDIWLAWLVYCCIAAHAAYRARRDAVVLQMVLGNNGPTFYARSGIPGIRPVLVVPEVAPSWSRVRIGERRPWLIVMGGTAALAERVREATRSRVGRAPRGGALRGPSS